MQVKAVIGGVEYTKIASCKITRGLFSGDTFSIGGCVAASLEITLINPQEIPKGVEVKIYIRDTGEWIPQGVFFIDQRDKDIAYNTLTLVCYDRMLMTEQGFFTADMSSWSFPASPLKAAQNIAERIGTTLDERTTLDENFGVEYPVGEYGDITMREVLSYIAMANAGNWIFTGEGKLFLSRVADIPKETSYLIEENGNAILFGTVRILVK